MNNLDSNKLTEAMNKLQKYDISDGYNPVLEDDNGPFILIGDLEDLICILIKEVSNHD